MTFDLISFIIGVFTMGITRLILDSLGDKK